MILLGHKESQNITPECMVSYVETRNNVVVTHISTAFSAHTTAVNTTVANSLQLQHGTDRTQHIFGCIELAADIAVGYRVYG